MSKNTTLKAALSLYNLVWNPVIPALRLNQRLTQGFRQRTLQQIALTKADLWIQAASSGESYLAWSILKKLHPHNPVKVIVTSNTRQGLDIINRAIADITPNQRSVSACSAYFPFDKPSIMETAVKTILPNVMVLLESEIWPGLLAALKKHDCHTVIINGRVTARSLTRYLIWPSFWRMIGPDKILGISENDVKRFATIFGKERVEMMSNIKFDNIGNITHGLETEKHLGKIIRSGTPFLVLGSTRREEEPEVEKIILNIHRRRPDTVIGLFPRHMHRIKYWKEALDRMSIPWTLRSEIEKQVSEGTVILWDIFGELSSAYKMSKGAFVGGSLAPLGGQNFLEPLTCGIIPVIGPSWENFAWVGREIVEQGLVHVATDWKEVSNFLMESIEKTTSREKVRKAALMYVKNRQGGTDKACRLIEKLLNSTHKKT
ncbi:MAG: glycosyltransferase N-terminal domain-containing protein [Thermodesulfobacteriota bacterium]|nr:glycosyltransferase N-terminal domain-containing protein [Thermodesulfobacteriota bacterium]